MNPNHQPPLSLLAKNDSLKLPTQVVVHHVHHYQPSAGRYDSDDDEDSIYTSSDSEYDADDDGAGDAQQLIQGKPPSSVLVNLQEPQFVGAPPAAAPHQTMGNKMMKILSDPARSHAMGVSAPRKRKKNTRSGRRQINQDRLLMAGGNWNATTNSNSTDRSSAKVIFLIILGCLICVPFTLLLIIIVIDLTTLASPFGDIFGSPLGPV